MKRRIDWLNHFLEFIVVVVGILLAFQLNTWSEENNQRHMVVEHMENIKNETFQNLNSLSLAVNRGKKKQVLIDSMLNLVIAGKIERSISGLSFQLMHINYAYLKITAFETLSQSGDIRFIEDFKMKNELVALYEYYKWTNTIQTVNTDFLANNYFTYAQENFDMVRAQLQPKEIYMNKKFKNILSGMRYQNNMHVEKLESCKEEVENFIDFMQWKRDEPSEAE